ncbi:hypothetical protein P5V15_011524 [Pogonomyrmex californicus]
MGVTPMTHLLKYTNTLLSRSSSPIQGSGGQRGAPRRSTLIDERDRRYARVTGHGAAMSRLGGADAERSARQSPQNGVVATSLRSTLQRSSCVVDPPARQANRRSVPRGSSFCPTRMQPGAQLQMYAGDRAPERERRFSPLASHTPRARLVDSFSRHESLTVVRGQNARFPSRSVSHRRSVLRRFAADLRLVDGPMYRRDQVGADRFAVLLLCVPVSFSLFLSPSPGGYWPINFLATSELMDQGSFYLSPSRSLIRLAELPHSLTTDDFLMAALATTDGVASSLCSGDAERGICIAMPANRAPTAPTVAPRHVIPFAAHDGCAQPQLRPEYGVSVCGAVSVTLKSRVNVDPST